MIKLQLSKSQQQIKKIVVILAVITSIVLFLNYLMFEITKKEVAKNEKKHLLESLESVTNGADYDNDLLESYHVVDNKVQYQICNDHKLKMTIVETSTDKGYSGEIKLLLSYDDHNRLVKVYALSHTETPGLGDQIEDKKSNWINQFNKLSLLDKILLKKDGGTIDAISGATITSRAVTNAIGDYATYFKNHQQKLAYCESNYNKNKKAHDKKHHKDDKDDDKGVKQ